MPGCRVTGAHPLLPESLIRGAGIRQTAAAPSSGCRPADTTDIGLISSDEHTPPVNVKQCVMPRAQRQQVLQVHRASVGPMVRVTGSEVQTTVTVGEAIGVVVAFEQPAMLRVKRIPEGDQLLQVTMLER